MAEKGTRSCREAVPYFGRMEIDPSLDIAKAVSPFSASKTISMIVPSVRQQETVGVSTGFEFRFCDVMSST